MTDHKFALPLVALFISLVLPSLSPAVVLRGPVVSIPTNPWQREDIVYVPLAAVCRAYGLRLTAVEGDIFIFDSEEIRLEVRAGSSQVLINEEGSALSAPAVWRKGKLMVPLELARRVLPGLRRRGKKKARFSSRPVPRVLLDPGHGGADPGAVGEGGMAEKEVVLEIARQVKALLEIKGLEVLLTRNGDTFVSLRRRAALANHSGADIFVSIHANAAHNHQAAGVETFYYAPPSDIRALRLARLENATDPVADPGEGDEKSLLSLEVRSCVLAGRIQKRLAAACRGPNRGVKTAPFTVLKYSRVPAVLVETGFLSNHRESGLLSGLSYRERLARAIAGGISDYFREGSDLRR